MAVDGKYAGHILISDIINLMQKKQSESEKSGHHKTVMLTGDRNEWQIRLQKNLEFRRYTANFFRQIRLRR